MKSTTSPAIIAGALLASVTISNGVILIDSSGITATSTSTFSAAFSASNTLDNMTLEGFTNVGTAGPPARPADHQNNHWITASGVLTDTITFDLGGTYDLAHLEVLNTSNTNWNDRETDTFSIATSTDGGGSYSAPSLPISLQDYTLGFQNVPLSATGVTHVQLTVTNDPLLGTNTGSADVSVGLNEVQFFQVDPVPEPSMSLLGLLCGAFLLRRKR